MRVKCIKYTEKHEDELITIGKIYEAKINPKWYDFAVQTDDDERLGVGLSRLSFEFVDGTPEEKALWDYCEENGIDGL